MSNQSPDRGGARSGSDKAPAEPARGARASMRAARTVARAPVTAVRAPARAVFQVGRYWQAERHTLMQGFAALSISAPGSLLAGFTLGHMTGRLDRIPGLLVLMPAMIGMRGSIFGSLASRLGTAIHTGQMRWTMDRSGVLGQNAYAATSLSLTQSTFLAFAAWTVANTFGLPSEPIGNLLAIALVAGIASGAIILVLTVLLARLAAGREWDMDTVGAPIVTFLGDVITLPALFLASFVVEYGLVTNSLAAALGLVSVVATVAAVRSRLPIARRIVRESALTLSLTGILSLLAGAIAEHDLERFTALPALVLLIPPFLGNSGALAGIVTSRITSKLHMGAVRPRLIPDRLTLLELSLAAPFALAVFTATGAAAHGIAGLSGFASPGLGAMIRLALLAGSLTTVGAAVIAYASAVAAFRFGLDPDNHGIPIVTSSIDLVGMMVLALTITALKVG